MLPETIKITTITSLSELEYTKKERNPKYNFLKHIRNSPKKVEIQDMETGEIIIYSSMYKAAKRFNQQSSRCYVRFGYQFIILKNLTPNKAASPYTLENFWLANDKL